MQPSAPGERSSVTRASAVESLIELYAERWNKIGSQADADRLEAELEHAAKSLAPEELLAYAAAPHLRGKLLTLCVLVHAQWRAGQPRIRGDVVVVDATDDPEPLSPCANVGEPTGMSVLLLHLGRKLSKVPLMRVAAQGAR